MLPGRRLLGSVAVQALGAAATFSIGIAIAAAQGPEAQGRYGLVRSAADLMLALALFGLPQGMVHAIHQQGVSPVALAQSSRRYAAVLLVLAVPACWLAAWLAQPLLPPWLDTPWALLALALGALGWVLHGLWRVLVLCLGDAMQFAWASSLPSLTLLVAVAAALVFGTQRFEWALAASGGASVLLVRMQLLALRAKPEWTRGTTVPMPGLARASALAAAPTLAAALQPWLTLVLLRAQGASTAEIGLFVLASLVVQAFALPASFVAPLLLARVSRAQGEGRSVALRRQLGPLLALCTLAALVAAVLLPWLVPAAFGSAYDGAVHAAVWMALCGPLVVASRLAVSVLMGQGAFRATAWHALARAAVLPLALLACVAAWPSDRVAAAALAWLLVEGVAVVLAAAQWRRLRHATVATL